MDLSELRQKGEGTRHYFGLPRGGLTDEKTDQALEYIDSDGLPIPGVRLTDGDPLYAYTDDADGSVHIKKYKGEDAFVDQVRLIGADTGVLLC